MNVTCTLFRVLSEKDEAVELLSSVECKGIIGNDNRHYVLDLLRTFPPDANFLPGKLKLSSVNCVFYTP